MVLHVEIDIVTKIQRDRTSNWVHIKRTNDMHDTVLSQ